MTTPYAYSRLASSSGLPSTTEPHRPGFTLTTHLVGWDDKWLYIQHKIERRGRLMAAGLARCCFRGEDGPVPPPLAFAAVGVDGAASSTPGYVRPWMAAESELLATVEKL